MIIYYYKFKKNEKSSVKNGRTSQRIRFSTFKNITYIEYQIVLKALKDIIHRTNQRIKVLSLPFNNWVEFGKMN